MPGLKVCTIQEGFQDFVAFAVASPALAAFHTPPQLRFPRPTHPFPPRFPSPLRGIVRSLLVLDGTGVVFLSSHFTEPDNLASRATRHLFLPIYPCAKMHQLLPPAALRAPRTEVQPHSQDHPTLAPQMVTWSQELFYSPSHHSRSA